MMKYQITVSMLLCSAALSGCMLTPVEQQSRWTDDVLAAQPAEQAPVYVPTLILSDDALDELADAQAEAIDAGADTREQGRPMRGPDPDTMAYAAQARARARPPE